MSQKVLAVVLGAGKGTHLYPLTKERSKPAIPFGGKYLLVDIPLSNCIHSGIRKMYVLTQFNSSSLNSHISRNYIFDSFSSRFVGVLAAEQTPWSSDWYLGTADAVRKNIDHLQDHDPSYYIILSGDQLYQINFRDMIRHHISSNADLTMAVKPVNLQQARSLDIIKASGSLKITRFRNRSHASTDISSFAASKAVQKQIRHTSDEPVFLASMGLYIFSTDFLKHALTCKGEEFQDIIPCMIRKNRVQGYIYEGYWEDLSTVRAFYEANIKFTTIAPAFNFYDESRPIFTQKYHLPPTKINYSLVEQSLIAEGSIITAAEIKHSVIGLRTLIEPEVMLDGVYFMGEHSYESISEKQKNAEQGLPNYGIGRGTMIRGAIIDENVRIGEYCRIGVDDFHREEGEYASHYVKEGLIIIPKNSVIPSGTVI